MEFITSRGFDLPTDQNDMENLDWFNMWSNENFPFRELVEGDILYWFNTKSQKLIWKTKVINVSPEKYSDKNEVFNRYPNTLGIDKYYDSRPAKGYLLHFKVKVIEKIEIQKPTDFRFPQLGWLRVDDEVALKWFERHQIEDTNVLDDIIIENDGFIKQRLLDLNSKMEHVLPNRIEKTISQTIRNDTQIVKALKAAADYKCQYPNCGQRITKKNGEYYIEVAHIKPVSKDGKSVLGNLLVLCPNHHKEFDFGDLKITEQTPIKLIGYLNEKAFEIEITNQDTYN